MSWAPPSPMHVTSDLRDAKHSFSDRDDDHDDDDRKQEDHDQRMDDVGNTSKNLPRKRSLEPGQLCTSPRIRKRLDDAKEHATMFRPVWEQSEVVQWLSACNCQLIELGRRLEAKGFLSLHSIAFLTEEEVTSEAPWLDSTVRQQLLRGLARLRHELFRM